MRRFCGECQALSERWRGQRVASRSSVHFFANRQYGLLLQEPRPFVFQTSLNDFHPSYKINASTSEPNRMAVTYSPSHQNIQDRFNRAGVEIMLPSCASTDGNRVTIPSTDLPSDYPPLRFECLR